MKNAPKSLIRCALCLRVKRLCNSHVIPEFLYKAAYDGKRRLVEYNPVTLQKTGLPQKGLYCQLLCADCEKLINDKYEKPFEKYWRNGEVLAPLATKELVVLDGIDYAKFKLFHLSVFFRAHAAGLLFREHAADISNHAQVACIRNFADIDLGSHAETIRQKVLSGDCGDHGQYPILCYAICNNLGEIIFARVEPGHMIKLDGTKGYHFTFGGCEWHYMLTLDEIPDWKERCLQQDGTLPVIKGPPSANYYYWWIQKLLGYNSARSLL